MTPTRAAAYLATGVLLLAWLASAAGVGEPAPDRQEAAQPVQTTGTEALASEVQAHAARLKERIASAPSPQRPHRNPFAFAPRPQPRQTRPAASVDPAPASAAALYPEPALTLIGVAENATPDGTVRTAIITAEGGELFMLVVGEAIGARYKVQAIGADSVQLADLVTGGVRRLPLR